MTVYIQFAQFKTLAHVNPYFKSKGISKLNSVFMNINIGHRLTKVFFSYKLVETDTASEILFFVLKVLCKSLFHYQNI